MIKVFEKYHGSAFSRLINKYGALKITANINQDNSSYIINNCLGIYIKFSTKRLTPWQFTFTEQHHKSIVNLSQLGEDNYLIFVCNDDGLCCITFKEYFNLISDITESLTKSIIITRFKNEKYYVSGSDGELKNKISDSCIEMLNS